MAKCEILKKKEKYATVSLADALTSPVKKRLSVKGRIDIGNTSYVAECEILKNKEKYANVSL